MSEPRINDRIRVPEVRLVGPNGEQVGIVRLEDALRLAQEADLDLVEVAPDARPPVCKLMDYGKYKYEADMKAREARRNQANTVLKEIRFRLKIDPHDYGTKKGHVERFLRAGDKVKVMIMFRGREQSRPEMGLRLLQRLADDVAELGFVESAPRQDGRNMIMVLGPTKKKSAARDQARRQQREQRAEHTEPAEAPAAEPKAEAKPAAEPKPAAVAKPAAEPKAEAKPAAEPKPAAAAKPAAEPKAEAKPAAKAAPKPAAKPAPAAAPKPAAPEAAKPAAPKPAPKPAPRPARPKAPPTD
ncbi:MAG: translation initiation factor IF-3 [Actinomycetales bacterium]|nr:translation initiation factor IF-3 [Actinomycetales bacterium]